MGEQVFFKGAVQGCEKEVKEVRRKGWEEGGRGKVEHCKKKVRDLIEAKKDAKPFDAGYTYGEQRGVQKRKAGGEKGRKTTRQHQRKANEKWGKTRVEKLKENKMFWRRDVNKVRKSRKYQ